MYLGTCAGWFMTSTDYWWDDELFSWDNTFGLFPTLEGSITDIATYPDYAPTMLSTGFSSIYYGGPTIGWKDTDADSMPEGAEVLFTFSDIECNCPAGVHYKNLLLFSPHLEAYENWGITGFSKEDRIKNYEYRME